ncbi:MAG: type restriction enzyme protein [Cyanobacteriota bacterium erpe_2018_sw_21hr_WHONDRS-SW48-000092_B_bin.40]|jgi:type I restriction enzyme M protein|nr:type restriction enzyme protein [Cyanobacteriota bacterium erpe_2018_sw_21hr_WHONDRS-SW48-000092_B_bin.40]
MAIKKSELYSSLWQSCDELRGGMDASQYKDYILVLLFVKYVTDRHGQKDSLLEVPKGASFEDMIALKGNDDIGEKINKIIAKLADANDLRGVIDVADFNDPEKLGSDKSMVDRLSKLVGIFQGLNFSSNRAEGDDLLGDAYEYLMRHFATESGKSKGQFYTPAEVSRIMAKVIGITNATRSSQSLYDPTCGSGSLLLKAHHEAQGEKNIDITIFGQEVDVATRAMAKMNMILHNCPTADIKRENTLSTPEFKQGDGLKTFDFAVANPPFSTKAWSNGLDPVNDHYKRFEYGIPPAKNGDYAFLLHIIASLKTTGKGAVILPHGVLFRGNVEADIRKRVVQQGFIKGIIGLPANLFYGTGIPACIIVLDKEDAAKRQGLFMIDASKGFIKDGNKNRLREQDIHKAVDVFNNQLEIPKYSRFVPMEEIVSNDFNLNIPRYIDSTEPEDLQDIIAHLQGGLPNRDIDDLSSYFDVFPTIRKMLFEPADRQGYSKLKIAQAEVKQAIFGHKEFTAYIDSVNTLFDQWKANHIAQLHGLKINDHPRPLIEDLSESLLDAFRSAKLLDAYDVYQHIMSYWQETMQDDVYMIVSDGWLAASKPRLITEDKSKSNKEKPDFIIGKQKFKADLVPKELMISHFFSADQANIEILESEVASIHQSLEELREEHTGEDGLLTNVADEGTINKASLTERLREIKTDKDAADERKLINDYLKLMEQESEASRKVKAAEKELDTLVANRYAKLTENEVKALVVERKWLAALDTAVHSELDRVSQSLTGRIKELAERYASPLPDLSVEVEELSAKVAEHLKKMGAVCK